MNYTVMTFEDVDVVANAHIAIEILLALLVQRSPRAQVAPAEVGRTNKDLFGLLHNGIVDGDVLALREQTVNLFLFLGGSIDR